MMTQAQHKKLVTEVIAAIKQNVVSKEDFSRYVEADVVWKEAMEPVRQAFEGSKWSVKVFVAVVKFLALLAPAYAGWLMLKKYLNT
jgi:hypothetical protein